MQDTNTTGRYEVTAIYKRATRDSFKHGCSIDPKDSSESEISGFRISGKTLRDVLDQIGASLGLLTNYVFLGDDGGALTNRFSINRQENDEGNDPTAAECARFEAGEIDLWLADYDFMIRHVIERGVTADEFRAQCPGVTVEG